MPTSLPAIAPVIAILIAIMLAVAIVYLLIRLRQCRTSVAQFTHAVNEAAETHGVIQLSADADPLLKRSAETLNELLAKVAQKSGAAMGLLASNRVLAREVSRMKALLESANEGVLALDTTDRVLFANRATLPFLLVDPEEAAGKPASECFRQQEVLAFLNGHGEEPGRAMRSIELAPEITELPEHYAVFHARSNWKPDEPAGHLMLFRDISRIKNVQKLQTQFVDSVAHELRTPLSSIRAYVEMLIDDETADPKAKYEFYNIIYEETFRLSELIDNLLNISMLEGGTAKLQITPTRLKRLLEDAAEVIRPQCGKKEIQLVIDLPDRLPTLDVDKRLFTVAVMNILSNAAKYTPDHGTVTLSTPAGQEELQISIRDTGTGISEEELPFIFDKFFRGGGVGDIHGSGVGLATARQIIESHGGEIRVTSRTGEGSEFIIVLPRTLINTSIGE